MSFKEKHWIFPTDHVGDESFRLATTDLMVPPIYSTYGLVFELCQTVDRNSIIQWVKKGLEKTLSQCRHLVGTIEANRHGDFSVVKRRDSAVQLHVQWLDKDDSISYSQLEKAHFSSYAFGDISKLLVDGVTYGTFYPLEQSPFVSAFQLNFIPGGLIFAANLHHCVVDNAGFGGFIYQLAENCYSIIHQTCPPTWDIQCLDRSRFRCRESPSSEKVNVLPSERDPKLQPEYRPNTALLLHLPKSKERSLKAAAKPPAGNCRISSYDSFAALLWRLVLRHRAKLYQADLSAPAFFYEIVNMRSRLSLPDRFQGNAVLAPTTDNTRNRVTLSEVISDDVPLWRLAMCIREITNTATAKSLQDILGKAALAADKTQIRHFSSPLTTMSLGITDVREPAIYNADFGFGRPRAFRHFFYPFFAESLIVVYPARPIDNNPDAGCEFLVPMEKELVRSFLDDIDVQQFFDFRGFEAQPPDGFFNWSAKQSRL